jgi:hypothetical protein
MKSSLTFVNALFYFIFKILFIRFQLQKKNNNNNVEKV